MRGIGEGKENLSEEGGNTPTALLPLPNLPARLASPLLPLQSLSCLSNSPWRFCLLKKKAPFLCLCGKGAFYWLGLFFLRMLHSFTGNPFADFFELCTVQSVILKGEPALYLSTLPKRGKARNRDSIRSKVLGRGGMGVRRKGGETLLQKGFPSLPPVLPSPSRHSTKTSPRAMRLTGPPTHAAQPPG